MFFKDHPNCMLLYVHLNVFRSSVIRTGMSNLKLQKIVRYVLAKTLNEKHFLTKEIK